MKVKLHGEDFVELLKAEPLLKDADEAYLQSLIKPENYIGLSAEIAMDLSQQAHQKALELKKLSTSL